MSSFGIIEVFLSEGWIGLILVSEVCFGDDQYYHLDLVGKSLCFFKISETCLTHTSTLGKMCKAFW